MPCICTRRRTTASGTSVPCAPGRSKMPHPWMQAYSVPEALTPRSRTTAPLPSTSSLPATCRPVGVCVEVGVDVAVGWGGAAAAVHPASSRPVRIAEHHVATRRRDICALLPVYDEEATGREGLALGPPGSGSVRRADVRAQRRFTE